MLGLGLLQILYISFAFLLWVSAGTSYATTSWNGMMRGCAPALAKANTVVASRDAGSPCLAVHNPANLEYSFWNDADAGKWMAQFNGIFADVSFGSTGQGGSPGRGNFQSIEIDAPGYSSTVRDITGLSGHIAYAPENSRLRFGLLPNLALGAGYRRGNGDAFASFGTEAAISHYEVPFVVSYRLTDRLTVGGQLAFSHWNLRNVTPLGTTGSLLGDNGTAIEILCLVTGNQVSDLCSFPIKRGPLLQTSIDAYDSWVPSFKLGFIWEATDFMSLGGSFYSGSKVEFDGSYRVEFAGDLRRFLEEESPGLGSIGLGLVGLQDFGIDANATMTLRDPMTMSLGTEIRVLPRTFLSMQVEVKDRWTLEYQFNEPIEILELGNVLNIEADVYQFNIEIDNKPVIDISAALQHFVTDEIACSLGFQKRQGGASSNSGNLVAPVGDGRLLAAGCTYYPSAIAELGWPGFRFDFAMGRYNAYQSVVTENILDTEESGSVDSKIGVDYIQVGLSRRW